MFKKIIKLKAYYIMYIIFNGEMAERLKAVDCKSTGSFPS